MQDSKDSTDGSSILPVSSLRSRFEQMANANPSTTASPSSRPLSPRPKSMLLDLAQAQTSQYSSARSSLDLSRPDLSDLSRGRNLNPTGAPSPRAFRTTSQQSVSPSPTRILRSSNPPKEKTVPTTTVITNGAPSAPKTTAVANGTPPAATAPPPSVTVEPPRSPPKNLALNIANPSCFLSVGSPRTVEPSGGEASPRHFRIPSRPHTPLVETRRSPQPPEPPPPRRSGELRREASVRAQAPPPPVKRAEKPKISSKPPASVELNETPVFHPASPVVEDRSPFTTPPSSPERKTPPMPRNKPVPPLQKASKSPPGKMTFEPPPVHHTVIAKRQDSLNVRADMTVPDHPSQRPALPARRDAPTTDPGLRPNTNVMLPPPRPADPSKPVIHSNIKKPMIPDSPGIAVPQRRISSTPSTSVSPPTSRPNGRSATINQTSERAPAEYRVPPPATPIRTTAPDFEPPVRADSFPKSTDYPDASHANRRPPFLSYGPRDIATKYETRTFDVFGEYVCTTGFFTRVWNILNGELVMSLSHGDTIKITALAFKPAAELKDEGTRLWLGNNLGELLEVDVLSQSIVASAPSAHTRREIVKIYRCLNELWTLDDSGTLHVWGPDSTGVPSLSTPSQSFRLPREHTFSMVVEYDLWHATGKDIRIFRPTVDGKTQNQVLTRPLSQANAGEITSGTTIPNQADAVYFGHTDGKISIYSRKNYTCLGLVSVSQYKINSLSGVGDFLWAGYSAGKIYVYDPRPSPWVIKKEWEAHSKPVTSICADRSSFWTLDRSHVVSLGADNALRFWDGLLQDDWLENEMQTRDASYCNFEQMRALVMTWNAGASTPHSLRYTEQDSNFFRDLLQQSNSPEILVFGFQELVDLEDKKTTAKSFFKSSKKKDASEQAHMSHQYRDWRDFLTRCLDDYMPHGELYHLLHTASMVGLFTCVFVKASIRERIKPKSIHGAEIKRGMGGLHGNKGALILRFLLDDTSLCFINCHLAAGQTQTMHRTNDLQAILDSEALPAERDPHVQIDNFVGGGDGSMITDHAICILNGDLNYRIDTMGRDTVVNAVKQNNLSKLLERDQLLVSRRKNPSFPLRTFHELPITFAPTYKYDVGTDNYDTSEKKRSPAWCDRLLYYGHGQDRIQQLDYRRHEVRVSDHRPVTGSFNIIIKSIDHQRRTATWEECQRTFKGVKKKQAYTAKMDFLRNVRGLDTKMCEQILAQQ